MTTLELTNKPSVLDFKEVATATHNALDQLLDFGARKQSTNVTVKGEKGFEVFSTSGFTVTIDTTPTAIGDERFRPYLMQISGQGFTYRSNTVGTVQTVHYTSEYTDQQWKEYVALTFFEQCKTLKTELAMQIGKASKRYGGKLQELIKALPKSSVELLDGRYQWSNFWVAVSNVKILDISERAQWCTANLIDPKNPSMI